MASESPTLEQSSIKRFSSTDKPDMAAPSTMTAFEGKAKPTIDADTDADANAEYPGVIADTDTKSDPQDGSTSIAFDRLPDEIIEQYDAPSCCPPTALWPRPLAGNEWHETDVMCHTESSTSPIQTRSPR
jgi:hypothetical protein